MADRIVSEAFLNQIIMVLEEATHPRSHREITGLIMAIHKLPQQDQEKIVEPGTVSSIQ